MLNDGRWKSQFETAKSDGTLDPSYRARQESGMFAFNEDIIPDQIGAEREQPRHYLDRLSSEALDVSKEKRPIYGYFSDGEHGAINSSGTIPPPNYVDIYGTINVKIKRDRALKKATLTFHDSLLPGRLWPPTPASKPHFASLRTLYLTLESLKRSSIVNWGESYTEVQFHGQLTMDDVESIHLSGKNGVNQDDIEKVRKIYAEYKARHPESAIQLIEF